MMFSGKARCKVSSAGGHNYVLKSIYNRKTARKEDILLILATLGYGIIDYFFLYSQNLDSISFKFLKSIIFTGTS